MLVPLVAEDDDEYHQPCVLLKVTFVKLLQPSNAYLPMLVTLSGIVILVSPLQPSNAGFAFFYMKLLHNSCAIM